MGSDDSPLNDKFFETNASNTELNRIVYDGPFQYGVPSNTKILIDQSFLNHHYSSPVKHQVELSNTSDSISFDLGIEYDFTGLEEWANRQKNSWLFFRNWRNEIRSEIHK